LIAGLGAVHCNLTGYNDLGEPVNRFSQFGEGSWTYMRTYQDETGNGVELLTVSNLEYPMGDCTRMTLVADSLEIFTYFTAGSYSLDDNQITLTFDIEYELLTKKIPNPLDVPGTIKRELSPPQSYLYTWQNDETDGLIMLNDKTYLRMDRVFDRVFDPSESGHFNRFLKIILLNNLSVVTRIPGFSGKDMLQYISKSTEFDGLMNGTMTFTVTISGDLKTTTSDYVFQEHMDLAGLTINGQFFSRVHLNESASGPMGGMLNFTARGRSKSWSGSVDYSNVYITETLPSAGTYEVTIDGESQQVEFSQATPAEFDFFDILAPDQGN
jgi:hypothetical protein